VEKKMHNDIYVIENGEYSGRMILGVASTIEEAARLVRSWYGPPYIIRWEEPKQNPHYENVVTMVGHFTAIEGKCGNTASEYDFTRYSVDKPWY